MSETFCRKTGLLLIFPYTEKEIGMNFGTWQGFSVLLFLRDSGLFDGHHHDVVHCFFVNGKYSRNSVAETHEFQPFAYGISGAYAGIQK